MASSGSLLLTSIVRPLLISLTIVGGSIGLWQLGIQGLADNNDLVAERVSSSNSPAARLAALADSPVFVYSEFGAQADTIWLAAAADPDNKIMVATVPHASNWGINASLSPDGSRIAYTALPPSGGDPESQAELWVVSTNGGQPQLVAGGFELRGRPIWSNDSTSVVVRRNTYNDDGTTTIGLVMVDLSSGSTEVVLERTRVLGLYAVGYSPDNAKLYYAELTPGGTDIGAVNPATGGSRVLFRASDSIARAWSLSPDGKRLSYLAPQIVDGAVVHRTFVADLDSDHPVAEALAATAVSGLEHLSAVWHPRTHDLTIGSARNGAAATEVALLSRLGNLTERLAAPAQGFDVPIAWSADGQFLAVRYFDGTSAQDPGREREVIIGIDGVRRQIPVGADAQFIGWLPFSPQN